AIDRDSLRAAFCSARKATTAGPAISALSCNGNVNRCRRTGRQRMRMDLHKAIPDSHRIGGEFLGERRRRASIRQPILPAVPGTGDAAVDDAALPDRAVLMRTEIGERADLAAVAEHGDAFAAGRGNDQSALVRDRAWRTGDNPSVT